MAIINSLRAIVGAIPRASVRRQAHRFVQATTDCRGTQRRVLRELIALNAESDFSREHGLNTVQTVEDFHLRFPVSDYETFRPAIEEVKRGNHQALLGPENRLLMFSLSSGTTSQSKYIPITQRFLDDYRRGWQIWGIETLDAHPEINSRKNVQFSSDHDRFRSEGGTPCGNISGLFAAMQKRIVRSMYAVPPIVAKIPHVAAKQYATLRLALAERSVALVTTANPSTLIHLANVAETYAERLIRDIADGTLTTQDPLPAEVQAGLRRRVGRKNRKRAAELERILETTGQLHPKDYWPELATLAVWTGGSAGVYLNSLKKYYGETPIRDHGLSASEGRMTIPLRENCSDGVLDITSHYFEFIPVEEYESDSPIVLEAHELEPGRSYYILLTTSSGLYRYDICDVVRCTGFLNTTPLLEFLHKGAHISNLTGEKVSESQVVTAVRRGLENMHLHLRHFTVSPVWDEPPHYQLLGEERDILSPNVGQLLAENTDRYLQEINCEYHEKRQTGRLQSLRWCPIPSGTWQRYAEHQMSTRGAAFEHYKHPCLVPDLEFSRKLNDIASQPRNRPLQRSAS
ncbi:MAG: GH3 auxin-responsive promoter family protein [Planctomycetaceae bacterium]|nr:GH3 auxin-responsive promoter family protein [Planctomycetaceae bacterium]